MLWTDLSCTEIMDKLKDKGFAVGRRIVKKLLYKHHFKKRKIQRRRTIKVVENRNDQFEKIAQLKQEYMLRIASEITSYSCAITEHPIMGVAL